MTTKRSLENRINGWESPARMLRNSPVGPCPFPYPEEHSNWRDEQKAWSTMYDRVLNGNSMVGFSTLMAYTVNLGAWYSLGMIDEASAQDGPEVVVVWGEENGGSDKPTVERHAQTEIRATIRTGSPALSL